MRSILTIVKHVLKHPPQAAHTSRIVKPSVFLLSVVAVIAITTLNRTLTGEAREKRPSAAITPPASDSFATTLNSRDARDRREFLAREFGKFPLYFTENRGQLDSRISYYVSGRDKGVYFAHYGVTITLLQHGPDRDPERWALKMDFLNANPAVRLEGEDVTETKVSYFTGSQQSWKAGLSTFSRVAYRDLWPGIDLVYSGTLGRMKYSFYLKPGADPNNIRIAYRGAAGVEINARGELEVSTPLGGFHDQSPFSFQEKNDSQVAIKTGYRIISREASGRVVYGFQVDTYDRTRQLVIDPAVLIYCGFIGGQGEESGHAITVDAGGNAYVVGQTSSIPPSFPVGLGPDPTYNGGPDDAFIAKVNPAGTSFVYIGYIGGAASDRATGVAVDSAGNAYISGETFSSQATFPVIVGPKLTYARNGDAFIAKLNAAGTTLDYCGYLGGDGRDFATGVAIDAARNAYLTGYTDSNESTFPVLVGPRLTYSGEIDAYVAKVNTAGTALVYAGYVGGSGDDYSRDIAVNGSGEAYITGDTSSTQTTFPVTFGPDLSYNGGDRDAFVARINTNGNGFIFAGYIGGAGSDVGRGIAVDASGNSYVTGDTFSDQASFPVLVGPDLTFNGASDAFVAKVNTTGTALIYSGYIGGSGLDASLSIDIDSSGNAYVGGETASLQTTFPVIGGPRLQANGFLDGFVAKLNPTGNSLIYCGYLGGSANERVNSVAVDPNGNAYVTGYTESNQTTFPVIVGPDLTFNGGLTDAFVAKIERRPDVTPPTIASVGSITRSRGSTGPTTLAFVSDEDTRPGDIFVGLRDIPTGVNVSTLLNTNGTVIANLTVLCTAPTGSFPVTIEATDGAGLKSTGTVTFNITGNTGPVVGTYPASQILVVGGSGTITPSAPPADNGVIETMVASAPGFTGTFLVDRVTGIISVQNAGPRGIFTVTVTATDTCQSSAATTFQLTVGQPNPVPVIASVSPNLITVGTPGVQLAINGSNFASDAQVLWNNSPRPTIFLSGQELRATLTPQDLAALGTANVTVSNPIPGGGISNAVTVSIVNNVAGTNAASFIGNRLAPDSIAALFGTNLATGTASAVSTPLPNELLGTQVVVRDTAGTERLAGLFFVSPQQINIAVPLGTVVGPATIRVRNGQGVVSLGTVQIALASPGIFTASSDGRGVAAAQVLRVKSDGVRTLEPVARFDQATQTWVAIPIDFGPPTDQLFLILFGTGVRFRTGLDKVEVIIGGTTHAAQFAGPVDAFVALDQINAPLNRSLAGRGEVDGVVIVDGQSSNTFRLAFR